MSQVGVQFNLEHPFLPSGWGPSGRSNPQLQDVNPAVAVIARLREKADAAITGNFKGGTSGEDGTDGGAGGTGAPGSGSPGSGGGNISPSGGGNSFSSATTQYLMSQIATITARLDAASGSAECNENGTITITLTI